jgi:glycolate oxidase iron-sulfur subunit
MTAPLSASPAPPAAHLAQAMARSASLCIKCGFCLPSCPTYRETGQEASSPRGRLELMYGTAQGRLTLAEIRHQLWFCLGCLACETACPSGIRFREMLEAGRIDDAEARLAAGGPARLRGLLLDGLLLRPGRLRAVVWALYLFRVSGLRRVLGGAGLLRLLWPSLARLERGAPPLGRPRPWRRALPAATAGAGRPAAILLAGCVMDAAFGEVHAATVKVLDANGYAVRLPEGLGCCGALHLHAGELARAQALARGNIAACEAREDAPIVVNAAGCGAALKNYGALLADDPDWAERARRFSARVQDVCELLAARELAPPTRQVPLRVAYDDPCHLVHAQGIREQPRRLLAGIPGLTLVPLAEADWCCGSAGSYSLLQPEMAARLLARKMRHLAASGADVVASGNPGCLWQLRLGVARVGLRVRVAHPVELLAEAYG